MQPRIRAEICKTCRGRGKYSTGKVCNTCKGSGLIGTDGVNEYILGEDGTGKLRVIDIIERETGINREKEYKYEKRRVRTKLPFRWLFLTVIAIIYIGMLCLNIITFKSRAITLLGTLFTVGLVLMVLIYDMRILKMISGKAVSIFIREPDDFIKAIKELKY